MPLGAVVCAALLSGCGGGLRYQATRLPDQYRVAAVENRGKINLARFASPSRDTGRIGAGDLLELVVATGYDTEENTSVLLRVDERGTMNVPLVGPVLVGGLEPDEAEQNIVAMAIERGIYRRPYVTLTIKRQHANKVTVVGAVDAPGVYELPDGASDLLGAVAAAGGLTDEAGMDVEIVRKSPRSALATGRSNATMAGTLASYAAPTDHDRQVDSLPPSAVVRINLADETDTDPTGTDYRLGDGDVVMVHAADSRVIHVMGLVRKPAQFELPVNEDVHLLDAIALAGGRSLPIADKVRIIRRLPGEEGPILIDTSVREAKQNAAANIRLAPGDLVSLEDTPITMAAQVFSGIFRFGFSAATPLF